MPHNVYLCVQLHMVSTIMNRITYSMELRTFISYLLWHLTLNIIRPSLIGVPGADKTRQFKKKIIENADVLMAGDKYRLIINDLLIFNKKKVIHFLPDV